MSSTINPFIAPKETVLKYRQRIANLAQIVKDENWDASPKEIPQEQACCLRHLQEMSTLAHLYNEARRAKVFAWHWYAEYVKAMLSSGLLSEIRSHSFFVVFGFGHREVDAPFEQGEITTLMGRDLYRMSLSNRNLSEELTEFLGPGYLAKYKSVFESWRTDFPLHLTLAKEVSTVARPLRATEENQLLGFVKEQKPFSNWANWSLRIPTAGERDQSTHPMPMEVIWLTYTDAITAPASWMVAIDNPEYLNFEKQPVPEQLPNLSLF